MSAATYRYEPPARRARGAVTDAVPGPATGSAIGMVSGVASRDGREVALGKVRVSGGVSITVDTRHGTSRVADVRERDGYKVRFPRRCDPPEAILINTGGGLASGDDILQQFAVGDGASLTVTTQPAERSYRCHDDATTRIDVRATVGHDGTLLWLPQETILFDRTRLKRSIDIDLAGSSRVMIAETVVFGRIAMGEKVVAGMYADAWRVRRDGRLIFAENVRITDAAFELMTMAAMSGGAHVATTLVLAAPDAENFLKPARAVLADAPFSCAASAWDGKLVVRGLAHRTEDVRRVIAKLISALGAGQLPRVWWT